jgi:diacylglycerol kinase
MVYFFTFFSILEGIEKIEWLMLFILPVYFTVSLVLFYFLLPVRWLTRLPFIVIYAISIYAILLSSNIFNVGVEKSLPLFRAAFSVNFLFLSLTLFLILNLILSFRLNFFSNFLVIFLFTLPLIWQFLWSVDPKITLSQIVVKYGLLINLIMAEVGWVFSFVPVKASILAVFLTAGFYSLLGLFQAYIEERLFRERIREYLFVLIFVFILTILSINW